jgi:hypothetical protein
MDSCSLVSISFGLKIAQHKRDKRSQTAISYQNLSLFILRITGIGKQD